MRAVADVEQVAEHLDRVALLAFAEQRGDRHAEVLAEQVEQRGFDRRDRVDRGAQVEGLQRRGRRRRGRRRWRRIAFRTALQAPIDLPTTSGRASSSVWRILSPPGTSPTPVRPALSVRMTRLRVKNGPCAPLRLSSMLSRPATGMTRISVTTGVPGIGPWLA